MTTQPDDHTLNACLARMANKDVQEVPCGAYPGADVCWQFINDNGDNERWNPLHDANQLEEVEAWLEEQGIEFIIISAHLVHLYFVDLMTAKGKFTAKDRYKKRAFALAVQAMEQSNNNNNKED